MAEDKKQYATHSVKCWLEGEGFHKVVYRVYGPAEASKDVETVICVHGLTRNSHDFDFLAEAMVQVPHPQLAGKPKYRVVSVDIAGRGDSDWLSNKNMYNYTKYVHDVTVVAARVTAGQPDEQGVTFIGTSMGGVIGMMIAASPNSFIRRLVVNDIGAMIPKECLQRIASYTGTDPAFDTFDEVLLAFKQIYGSTYGPTMTDDLYHHLALHGSYKKESDGKFHIKYDPEIKVPFLAPGTLSKDVEMWPVWNAVSCPVLLLRGENSDVLLPHVATEMAKKKNCKLINYPSTGHVPPLMTQYDISDVVQWIGEAITASQTMAEVASAYDREDDS